MENISIKMLELHYPMIQFLIMGIITLLFKIQPIEFKHNCCNYYLIEAQYVTAGVAGDSPKKTGFRSKNVNWNLLVSYLLAVT